MAKRKIIKIDEEKCNGCGACVTACSEGALQIIDGKAKLVREDFCDGFGDCLGECPTGALVIEERDAPDFSFQETKQHLMQTQGLPAVRRFEDAAKKHGIPAPADHQHSGCPGSAMRLRQVEAAPAAVSGSGLPGQVNRSELEQWPVHLRLVRPGTEIFRNKELVVLSTCSPVASADIHWRFLRGRAVVVACPKLDDTSGYAEKLGEILADPTIPRVIVVRMEVPCCGGLTRFVQLAKVLSGREDLEFEEIIISVAGEVSARPSRVE